VGEVMSDYLEHLRSRLKKIIIEVCNVIGCDNCDLKFGENCSALDLQDKIYEEENEWVK
jgi:hypothetical protein